MKWYQDGQGHTSSMRIMAMMGTTVGCLTVISCIVGLFLGMSDAVALAAIGSGMAVGGEWAKGWQAKTEGGAHERTG